MSIDGDKMKQALLNLVKNAGEAMPHGGMITIDAFRGQRCGDIGNYRYGRRHPFGHRCIRAFCDHQEEKEPESAWLSFGKS